jgi:hypothetical protein
MKYKNYFGIGVAGNFTGHLEQANEASDFTAIKVVDEIQPKAIFPFYFPHLKENFLSTYPISSSNIILPETPYDVQIEPEVALICNVIYEDNKVSKLIPTSFGAYNDCSIRRPDALKISHKKNWGKSSKGLSEQLIKIDSFNEASEHNHYSVSCFHKSNGEIHQYGETSKVANYSYNNEKLLDWIIDRLNNQTDIGPAEDMSQHLAEAEYPEKCIISIGATRYTEYGQQNFLKAGDTSVVVVFDHRKLTFEEVLAAIKEENYQLDHASFLVQLVESP